jgi:nitrate reductase cytochrome c-type subunit
VRFEEKEIENMAKNFPETIPEDIEKLQVNTNVNRY